MAANRHRLVSFVILLNRLALGLYFTLAGMHKINGGVDQFVNGPYAKFIPTWVPSWLATPVGYGLPFVEISAGVTMMTGLFTAIVAIVMVVTLLGFTTALILADKFFSLPGPMHPNVLLTTIALLIAAIGPGHFSLDAWRGKAR